MSHVTRMLFFLLALLISGRATAQDELRVYAKGAKQAKRTYRLPLKVRCFFKNGTTQDLLLTSLDVDDSLHFRQYYNQANFDCRISDVAKIRIRRSLNLLADVIVVGGAGATAVLTGVVTIAAASFSADEKPGPGYYLFAIGPFVAGVSGATYLFYRFTQNTFRLDRYEIH